MKSRAHHKRSRWAQANAPEALRRRAAAADARREAIAATLPPAAAGPEPLSLWQTVLVLDGHGRVMHTIDLRVPVDGHRCDQHAAEVDGRRELLTATQVGRRVAGMICKRPSLRDLAEVRRDDLAGAQEI